MQHFKVTQNKEENFIQKTFLPLTLNSEFSRGLKDDVALLNNNLIIKTDSLCVGIHVKKNTSAFKIGHKLLARNLSDIASKGGRPIAFTLSIFKHNNISNQFLLNFTKGLKNFNIPLIGGDCCNSLNSYFSANITVFAEKTVQDLPSRSGAKIDDNIYITNSIGRAFLGFKGIKQFKQFYETPIPQINLMQKVLEKYKINASIDISDGFLKDITSLLNTSKVGAIIEVQKILPANYLKYIKEMLTFGDDYEIIFTSPDKIEIDGITKIGKVQDKKILTIKDVSGIKINKFGYQFM